MHAGKPVFIVHTAPDKAAARACRDALGDAGVEAFLDDEIEPGLPWDDVLEAALDAARVIVVLVTPEWKRGHYNKDEVATAIARARESSFVVRVVPVFFAGGTPRHSPYGLQRIQGVELGQVPQWNVLVQAMGKLLGQPATAVPTTPSAPVDTGARPDGGGVRTLRDTLIRLYPQPRGIRRVLRDAGVDTAGIHLEGSARDVWDEALEVAERHGQVGAIEAVAREEYPAAFAGAVASGSAAATPSPAASNSSRLTRDEVDLVVEIALRHNADRDLLLHWLPDGVAATLPARNNRRDQLMSDVTALNGLTAGEELPVVTWLTNLGSRVKPFPRDYQVVMDLVGRLGRG